jgi:ribonuclease J
MAYAGHVSVSLVVDQKGKIVSGPEPRISGFPEGKKGEILDVLLDAVEDTALEAYDTLSQKARKEEDLIEDRLRARIKRRVREMTDKRTIVEVIAHKVKT